MSMQHAIKAASNSTFRQMIGCVVMRGGNILSSACNEIRHKKGNFTKKWENSLHAEQAALLMIAPERRKGVTMYVARIRKNRTIGCAKPCPICQELIVASGVKAVYYTDDCGNIVKL